MFKEIKTFANEHKKEIVIGTGVLIGTIGLGFLCRGLINDFRSRKSFTQVLNNPGVKKAVKPKWDPGRDCIMRFFVEGTEEFLGEAQCKESYVKDILDIVVSEAF